MAFQTFLRRSGLVVAGTGVYIGTSYFVYQYMQAGKEDQEETKLLLKNSDNNFSFVSAPNRHEKFDEIAARYDFMINNDERFMGMGLFRRCLLYYHAKGTVLEMAAGTGRNCSFYPKSTVDRVVLTDTSDQMLQQARQKIRELQHAESNPKPQFAVLQADSGNLQQFADNTFDTVVDTFGLCSFDNPVAVLNEMERVCKPNGKILLLEHGRSKTWQWVTHILDDNAERHAKNWGCVHNRDLDHIIKESGLVLETMFTWHFGTTYYMVCRPNKQKTSTSSTSLSSAAKMMTKDS